MPKFPYKQLGISFDRDYRNDLNQNLKDIESDIKELGQSHLTALDAADEAKKQANIAKTEAAKATVETERLKNVDAAQFDARLTEVSEQLAQSNRQTQTLTHGTQVTGSADGTASPLKVEFYGRTLVNLLGSIGGFDSDSSLGSVKPNVSQTKISVDNSNKVSGQSSLKITRSATGSSFVTIPFNVEAGKYYLISVKGKNESNVITRARILSYGDILPYANYTDWKYGYLKINPNETTTLNIYLYVEGSTSELGSTWYDELAVYSIPKEIYDKIGVSLTDADVERMFPYVDSVQHVKNPVVTVEGANLLPPFSEWDLHSNAKVISPYKMELSPTSNYQQSFVDVNCIGNEDYVISMLDKDMKLKVQEFNGSWSTLFDVYTNAFAFKTSYNTSKLRIVLHSDTKTGILTCSDIMLNLGSTAKPFVPRNPSYLYAETTLAGNDNKKDILSYNESVGRWEKTKWWEHVVLDGGLTTRFYEHGDGWKRVSLYGYGNNNNYSNENDNRYIVIKYDGRTLKNIAVATATDKDQAWLNADSDNGVKITVSNADSGWTESMTPTADMIKAYFNGWKVKSADGNGKPTAWQSVVDGSDAPTQTLAYVSTNRATNYTPYKLSYVLATPQTINVTDKIEGDLVVSGLTQVEVNSGVIVREKVTPVYFSNYKNYKINDSTAIGSILKNKSSLILAVFKNGRKDDGWAFDAHQNAHGKYRANLDEEYYDPTAEYSVTYLLLDRHAMTCNATEVLMTYAKNIRGALDETVKKQSDIATEVTIHARSIIDLYAKIKALEV